MEVTAFRFRRQVQASTAVIALLIVSIGSLGLLGAVSILQARHGQIEAMEEGLQRRVREMNSRALARQFFHDTMLNSPAGTAGALEMLDGSGTPWARFAIPADWADFTPFTTSEQGLVNPASHSPAAYPFALSMDVEIHSLLDGDVTDGSLFDLGASPATMEFRVCGRNPAVSGTQLQIHSRFDTPNKVDTDISVVGRSMFWRPDSVGRGGSRQQHEVDRVNFVSNSYTANRIEVTHGGGGTTMPDNFPLTGYMHHPTDRNGGLDVISGTSPNSLVSIMGRRGATVNLAGDATLDSTYATGDGSGNVVIQLDSPDLPDLIITNNADRITLQGQTSTADADLAATLAPVFIVYLQDATSTTDFTDLRLEGLNGRAVILGIRKENGGNRIECEFFATTPWRGQLYVENSQFRFDCNNTDRQWQGGIFTDARLDARRGDMEIIPETDATILTNYHATTPRWMWVEAYQK